MEEASSSSPILGLMDMLNEEKNAENGGRPLLNEKQEESSPAGPDSKEGTAAKDEPQSCLTWNWKNITIAAFLWVAYLLCNASFSVIGPFFPEEVCK